MQSRAAKGNPGVIFDMDGVISDTQDLHSQVESIIFERVGIILSPEEITARFAGVGDKVEFVTLFEEHGISHYSVEKALADKWQLMGECLVKDGLKSIPYALELIDLLHGSGYVLAIASGAPRLFIKNVIETFALEKYLSCFVSSEDVPNGKPAPDVFLKAAKHMAVDPSNCVVIEDAVSGMEAAAQANMGCIGLVKDVTQKYPTEVLVSSLSAITLELVRSVRENVINR